MLASNTVMLSEIHNVPGNLPESTLNSTKHASRLSHGIILSIDCFVQSLANVLKTTSSPLETAFHW